MCGIAGIMRLDGEVVNWPDIVSMTDIVEHRGPDDFGFLIVNTKSNFNFHTKDFAKASYLIESHKCNLAFGHRRLSILDLSEVGRQPMSNVDGTIWITYNGEIYNYKELRKDLEADGFVFQTNTDTEVLINSYDKWGEKCVTKFNGMFSFVIWDKRKRQLFCARDRFGIKPFYYFFDSKNFLFASEIKQLLLSPQIIKAPDRKTIFDYLYQGKIDHSDQTFFKKISKLKPSHYMVIQDKNIRISRYWDISATHECSINDQKIAVDDFMNLFTDAVRLRLRSDVPVGSCLSGGIDSSAIVCLLAKLLKKRESVSNVNTFSITFADPNLDESSYINSVLKNTGVNGHFVQMDDEALLTQLSQVIYHQDEPFGSSSILVQYSVMKLAQKYGVKVLLDGQGADEVFAGYPNFIFPYLSDCLTQAGLFHFVGEIQNYAAQKNIKCVTIARIILQKMLYSKISWLIHQTPIRHISLLRRKQVPPWMNPSFFKEFYREDFGKPKRFNGALNNRSFFSLTDSYLPSYLRYEDRNSMAFSIETRLPFLDYRLIEFGFKLGNHLKLGSGISKRIIREAMQGIVPQDVLERRDKLGFVTPEDRWLAVNLKNKMQEILVSKATIMDDYINIAHVADIYRKFCAGEFGSRQMLWRVLNLSLWFDMYFK